jgi:hypothetical protein
MAKLFRKGKYNNKKVMIEGKKFESIGEGNRYLYLKGLQQSGKISKLETQVVFEITPKQINHRHHVPSVCSRGKTIQAKNYKADFVYLRHSDMRFVINDFKGVCTQVYKDKIKDIINIYGDKYDILETYAKKNPLNY